MARKAKAAHSEGDLSMRARAYLYIQQQIASGNLPAGSAVSELQLSKDLGTSRTPIREAIGQLASEGLLEQIPKRGTVVVKLTRQDIVDLFELREALEVYAVGKAARLSLRSADLDRLHAMTREIGVLKEELTRSGNLNLGPERMHRFISFDLTFHTLLVRLARNERIQKVVNETRLLIRIFAMYRSGHSLGELERIHASHCEILRAVTDHDPESAMRAMTAHIQVSGRERLDEHDHWEREASLKASLHTSFDMKIASRYLR